MSSILSSAIDGLVIVFSWPNFLYPLSATLIAMVVSILPGISGVALMAIVIPLTIFWEPLEIALFFGALVGGATFMGSVTSILINVPGRTSNAATALDGYPLSRQGRAKDAIACSATASALGSTFGVFVLFLLIPVMLPMSRAFGPFDLLMAIIWGLSIIAFVVGKSWLKGLIAAGLGMSLSFLGADQQTGEYRFVFGTDYLKDGLSPILVFLGIFAVAEMMELANSKSDTISGKNRTSALPGSALEGIKSVFRHFWLFIRCSTIGTVIGMMPGVGAVVASFVAYGHANQSAKDPENFGKGDIRGVIAPEAANDAKDGGSLVPTLAIGLPGGLGTAMLLTAFTVHGIVPGPSLLSDNLVLVFVLIWSLFFSNWMTSIVGLGGISWFARITTVPNYFLIPIVLGVVALSAYTFRGYTLDVLVVFIAAVFGFYMKRFDWPRVPFVIAFILGPYFENHFHVSRQLFELDRIDFTRSPIAFVLLALTLVGFAALFIRKHQFRDRPGDSRNSIVFASLIGLFFLLLLVQSGQVSGAARLVPVIVLSTSLGLLVLRIIFHFFRDSKMAVDENIRLLAGFPVVIGVFLYGPLVVFFGPVPSTAVFMLAWFLLKTQLGITRIVLISALAAGIAHVFTRYGLQRTFDGGILLGFL